MQKYRIALSMAKATIAYLVMGCAVFCLVTPSTISTAQDIKPEAPLPTTSEKGTTSKQPVMVIPTASDDEIASRLERILQSTGWFDKPRVSVREGIIFLDGMTSTPEHQRWAGSLAENTQGAVAVVNRIESATDAQSTFERAGRDISRLYQQSIRAWPVAALIIVVIIATLLSAKVVRYVSKRLLANRISSPLLLAIVAQAISAPFIILGIYFVLQIAGLTRLALTVLGGTGVMGIIVGFAFRDIAENFLASLILSARNPFRSGDLIEIGSHTGIVQNLNTRSTVLLTLDGNHVQIPNATVFKSTIKNYSSIPSRRAEFLIGIGYDSSTTKAQSIIAAILANHPAVLDAPEPLVLVDELGPATVNLRVQYWFNSTTFSPAKINSALLRLAKNALLTNDIELPDPAREVVFPKGVPIIHLRPEAKTSSAAGEMSVVPPEEDTKAVTTGEGDLSNESEEVRERSKGTIPEGEENFLKS